MENILLRSLPLSLPSNKPSFDDMDIDVRAQQLLHSMGTVKLQYLWLRRLMAIAFLIQSPLLCPVVKT